jgi:hypothetical protein
MVLEDALATLLERGAELVGAHGFEAGLLATAVIVLWHGHSLLSLLLTGVKAARLVFIGVALVGLLLVVAVSLGWITIGDIPVPLVGVA